ncbi:MAG: hypothetical protein ACI9WU_003927 [Myxococcota bacterium]|jgi:hypothetical protein
MTCRRIRPQSQLLALLTIIGLSGCEGATTNPAPETDSPAEIAPSEPPASDEPEVGTTATELPMVAELRCEYVNAFSQAPECKDYVGTDWTEDTARADCDGSSGTFADDATCGYDSELGRCTIGGEADRTTLVFPGDDPGSCALTQTGCEVFAGGSFAASDLCGGETTAPMDPPSFGGPFTQPYLECREPLAGEPAGDAPEGEVCTWTLISGCTEEGRRYEDYAECSDVYTQRPYFPYDREPTDDASDPRLQDTEYLADSEWVKEQVEACACVCCHSDSAPNGASGWFIDAGPLWMDTIDDDGLAMMAGLVDSTAFGAFPSADNNGFDRSVTGVPTTDITRMQEILIAEYLRRDLTLESAEDQPPFGGPLYTQLVYEPSPCDGGQGVDAKGNLVWSGGGARYVYVMEDDASTPGVPPNLDEPKGTLWLIDVPTSGQPITEEPVYGVVPEGARQRVPASGQPADLASGQSYYLYVLADIGIPITRCTFTAP